MNSKVHGQQFWKERQLTLDAQNHELDHNENFSPDDLWLVYDTRPDPAGIGQNAKIEKVNILGGNIQTVYNNGQTSLFGPGVGAVSYHPFKQQVVFIHGLQNADKTSPYAGHRRTGVIVDESDSGIPIFMDSRDTKAPFTPGALRGGTHRHQWSSDGEWIGFTYNDALMVSLESETGSTHDLRTVGVAKREGPKVNVDIEIPGEDIQGSWYSVLAVKVVANPASGSNEIKKAYSDWWVGNRGYQKANGEWQRARAFMGDLVTENGNGITEVFLVDIPEDIHVPGPYGPLEGTLETMPMPPRGAVTKRLTFTQDRKYPGVATVPRHWLSSPMDGSFVSYLAKDDAGVVQVFLVPTLGGAPIQASFHPTPIQGMVRWHPHRREFTYICDNSLFMNTIDDRGIPGTPVRITEPSEYPPFAHCYSRSGERLAFNKVVPKGKEKFIQIFIADRP